MKKLLAIAALVTVASLSSALAQSTNSIVVSSFSVSNDGYPLECLGELLTNPQFPDFNSDAPRVELHGINTRDPQHGWPSPKIVPPTSAGLSDTNNPLLEVTCIGNESFADGLFCLTITNPVILTNCTTFNSKGKYFAFFFRVYDKSTVEASHYYADSSTFQYSAENTAYKTSSNVTFKSRSLSPFPGTHPDSDGDGLSDEDEINQYGTDPDKADTDDDGLDDATEIAYGLDPRNPIIITLSSEPVEGVASDTPEGKDWYASWHVSTNPRVQYTLQFVPDLLDLEDGTHVHPADAQRVTASSTKSAGRSPADTNWSEIVNDWVRTNSIGFMRVLMSIDTNSVTAGE
jgi:hypothetical protein